MFRKSFAILLILLSVGWILTGCPKTAVMREDPAIEAKRAEDAAAAAAAAEKERIARLEQEEKAKREREMREKTEAAQRAQAEAAKKTLEEANRKTQEEAARRAQEEAAKKAAEKDFEKSLVAKKYPGIDGEVLESKLLKDIHFDFDRYDIQSQNTALLKENAEILKKYPKVKIQIEGHCDERGTIEYNLALGERRANSAKRYLVSIGIPSDRISTITYGKERPLDPAHTDDAWAKNRRAHFVIIAR